MDGGGWNGASLHRAEGADKPCEVTLKHSRPTASTAPSPPLRGFLSKATKEFNDIQLGLGWLCAPEQRWN